MNVDLDLLVRLRDIHAPPEPGWWAPAPGWWLLALLAILLVWTAIRVLPPRIRRWRQQIRLERELQSLKAQIGSDVPAAAIAASLSALLRRAALITSPDTAIAGTHGEAWVAALERMAPDLKVHRKELHEAAPELLTALPYRREVTHADLQALAELVGVVLRGRVS